jgi:hypothetical protein
MFGKLLNKKDRCYLLASATDEKSVQVSCYRWTISFYPKKTSEASLNVIENIKT